MQQEVKFSFFLKLQINFLRHGIRQIKKNIGIKSNANKNRFSWHGINLYVDCVGGMDGVDGVDGFETGKCKDIVAPSDVFPNNPTPTCKDTT